MNFIIKAWRNFKLVVAKRRQKIRRSKYRFDDPTENKFRIGDLVNVICSTDFDADGGFYNFTGTGEVVDAFYGFDINNGYKWHYKVQYKTGSNKVIILYEEAEICIDAAWIRDQKLKELGI